MDKTQILVVEDEDSFVDALTVGLEREGFIVNVAINGTEALKIFEAVSYTHLTLPTIYSV